MYTCTLNKKQPLAPCLMRKRVFIECLSTNVLFGCYEYELCSDVVEVNIIRAGWQ